MKKIKTSFVKKAGAVVLSCVLLCGQGLSAAAASSAAIQREPEHKHAYTVPEGGWQLIGFAPYQHHKYTAGYNLGVPVIETCAIWQYVYSGVPKCNCGATLKAETQVEYVHLNCGQ